MPDAGPIARLILLLAPATPALAAGVLAGAAPTLVGRPRRTLAAGVAAALTVAVVGWLALPALRGEAPLVASLDGTRAGWVDLRVALSMDRWAALVSFTAAALAGVGAVASAWTAVVDPRRTCAIFLAAAATIVAAMSDTAWLTILALELAGAVALLASIRAPSWVHVSRRGSHVAALVLAASAAMPAGVLAGDFAFQREPRTDGWSAIALDDPSDARITIDQSGLREEHRAPARVMVSPGARVTIEAARAAGAVTPGPGETVDVVPTGASYTYRVLATQELLGEDRRGGASRNLWIVVIACLFSIAAATGLAQLADGSLMSRAAAAVLAALGGPIAMIVLVERMARAGAVSGRAPLIAIGACFAAMVLTARAVAPRPSGPALPIVLLFAHGASDVERRLLEPAWEVLALAFRLMGRAVTWIDQLALDAPWVRLESALMRVRERHAAPPTGRR